MTRGDPCRPSGLLPPPSFPQPRKQQELGHWGCGDFGPFPAALGSSPAGVPEGLWLASSKAHVDTRGKVIYFQEHLLPAAQPGSLSFHTLLLPKPGVAESGLTTGWRAGVNPTA